MPQEPTENAVNSGDHVVTLRRADGATVYLLGTCHVSATSASEASALVREVRPSTVVLELCPSRRSMLYETSRSRAKDAGLPPPPRRRRNTTTKSEVTNTLWNVLTDWTEAISLQYAALDSLVGETNEVGAEFRAANDAAISVGAEVVLVNGRARGARAELLSLDLEAFCASVRLLSGEHAGATLERVEYEDMSKLAA